jgi:iron complex outermembrane receptor protein
MLSTTKSNIYNLIQAFNQKSVDNFFGKAISAISALAIINASAYSGYISAQSQATVEEVVVTARKKSESLQDVPLSVATLGEGSLEEKGNQCF